jgi:1-acyl-sn-glycerol-3-phosphate acyltransferase
MNAAFKHPLRVGARVIWLFGELVLAALRFVPCVLFRSRSSTLEARAGWFQIGCRRVLRIFNVQINATGPIPRDGLLISNHLSYLDVLVLGALMPSVFIAKHEVKHWPVFGWFAQLAGTLFTDRERRTQVGQLNRQLRTVLNQGVPVVLFPEGTSSDGRTILPFKSALLEPATDSSKPLSTSLIHYQLDDGDVGEEVCYWKDMTFLPHLFNLWSKKQIDASVCFSELHERSPDRKHLALQLHSEVSMLKTLLSTNPSHRLHVQDGGPRDQFSRQLSDPFLDTALLRNH